MTRWQRVKEFLGNYWIAILFVLMIAGLFALVIKAAMENHSRIYEAKASKSEQQYLETRIMRYLDDQFGVICYVYNDPDNTNDKLSCVNVGVVETYQPKEE